MAGESHLFRKLLMCRYFWLFVYDFALDFRPARL